VTRADFLDNSLPDVQQLASARLRLFDNSIIRPAAFNTPRSSRNGRILAGDRQPVDLFTKRRKRPSGYKATLRKMGMSSIPLKHRVARFIGHQHYIRRGRGRLIRRLLTTPESSLPVPFKVDFFGSVYSGDLHNFIDWSVYIYGAYSNNELQPISPNVCASNSSTLPSTM